jgi:UDP-glucose 4-epimerase
VVETLLEAGHEVAVLDNLSTGKRENLPRNIKLYEVDITNKKGVENAIADFKPEVVDHHAAQISVSRSVREPLFDAQQNILGSINLLQCATEKRVQRFIFASTGGALYGDTDLVPSDENTPVVPLSPYGIAKASIEHYVRFFTGINEMEAVVLRYANVYGPRQDPHGEAGVVAIFSLKSIAGQGCTIFGSGEQTRDFVFVKDVARANLLAVDGKPGTYNIGTGAETTVNTLFEEFKKITPSFEVVREDARSGDVFRSALDASRAKTDLNWKPQATLSEGIKETYQWFQSQVSR